MTCGLIFFFQAEDGIRDFCLSRGLGDVYKRQEFDDVGDEGVVAATRSRSARYPRLLGDEYHSRSLCDTGSAK